MVTDENSEFGTANWARTYYKVEAKDAAGNTNLSGNRFVEVKKANAAPVATEQAVTVDEDTSDNVITLAGTDADGDTLTYAIATQPAHGTLTLNGAVAKYTPEANYAGADSFTFTVNDGKVDSAPATVSITVTDVAEPEATIAQIVERHNYYRKLDFTDSDLVWDETLADHAQQWADYLATNYTQALADADQSPHASNFNKDSHGLPYLGEGENIAWASNTLKYIRTEPVDITVENSSLENYEFAAVDMWANEKAYYDYATNSGNGHTVGHYTQVVWQKTTKVGCGKAKSTTDLGGEHIVCRYQIPGNMSGEKPYCTEYSVGQYYNDSSLVFTDAMINNKTFASTKILEDRSNCTVRDMTSETLVVNGDGTGTFQSFDFFNDGGYVANFNFTKSIDAQGVLHMSGDVNGNNSVMTLKLIGQDADFYNVDAEWTLNSSNPGYTRRAIFRLAK